MIDIIRVQPARALRRDFARWAVAQEPKVRTVSESAFGVPPRLFTDMPEALLRGSLVDGRAYVAVEDEPAAPHDAPELLGVDRPDAPRLLECGLCYEENGQEVHPHPECPRRTLEATPGDVLPAVPASAYGPGAVPLEPPVFAPLDDAPPEREDFVMVGEDGPETVVPLGDTSGDTGGPRLPDEETAAGAAPPVTSGDIPGDEGDTGGDTAGDSDSIDPASRHACPECPRSFGSGRGLDVHLRRAHREA
ncbi:C2H2-type zinc finger protein [Streptomyces fuscigenes]|uniref:C2H2-type zinc finger protein n=1 Tax=Streptomyces fuscigenes TaxID=1528880 RepID=UPI001F40A106|nr:C2H2-type zinc finger protein [Streptomyces fuscigenes]MCF3960620.1 C2H2-type zinc finger protein [Streptomyces fuscigenes]